MLNGLDLFSGIGGIALALDPWVRPVAYCEIDRYAQAVMVSRMAEGALPLAPIWDDVRTLHRGILAGHTTGQHDDGETIDIITGGFPCQDISVAGNGAGLAGERSGLFFEIARLAGELRPAFIFLENVPAITTRGGRDVVGAITALGYDCRWCVISAAEIGANHKRERWFLLAHTNRQQHKDGTQTIRRTTLPQLLADTKSGSQQGEFRRLDKQPSAQQKKEIASHSSGQGLQRQRLAESERWQQSSPYGNFSSEWWTVEPDVGRVDHGIPFRMDRIKGLGNSVVPLQVRTAFEILSGLRGIA